MGGPLKPLTLTPTPNPQTPGQMPRYSSRDLISLENQPLIPNANGPAANRNYSSLGQNTSSSKSLSTGGTDRPLA